MLKAERRYGAVVRTLASHQCGPGSIPGLVVICGLVEFVVGSRPCSKVFSPGTPVFLPPQSPINFQIPIRPGNGGEKSHSVDSTEIVIIIIIFYFYYDVKKQSKAEQQEKTSYCELELD